MVMAKNRDLERLEGGRDGGFLTLFARRLVWMATFFGAYDSYYWVIFKINIWSLPIRILLGFFKLIELQVHQPCLT
ncbi:hypothetical protein OIU79_016789, partial [Salix purpurea]